ncbi:hypothetical protein [Gorillibacterium massiliense]|uniref:hypothetical protein n=1 Tax=Gorillibacterium massiliense TaxID=1280390 RepID=UPI000694EC17|nr:hypothetical protein [Gorillibacterium massiliense]
MKRSGNKFWIATSLALFVASLAVASAVCAESKAAVNGDSGTVWSAPGGEGLSPHSAHGDHDAGRMHGGGLFHDAAEILGMRTDELRAELEQGKSLADVAKTKGISEKDLVAKLTDKANSRIDQGVKSGHISQEKAAEIKKQLSGKLQAAVGQKGLQNFGKHHEWMAKRWSRVATIIGISEEELAHQLKAGKSVAEIAQAHGVSRDKLIEKLKDGMTSDLEKFVDHKRTDKQPEKGRS